MRIAADMPLAPVLVVPAARTNTAHSRSGLPVHRQSPRRRRDRRGGDHARRGDRRRQRHAAARRVLRPAARAVPQHPVALARRRCETTCRPVRAASRSPGPGLRSSSGPSPTVSTRSSPHSSSPFPHPRPCFPCGWHRQERTSDDQRQPVLQDSPGEAPQCSSHRRCRPRAGARDAEGRRVHRRRSREAAGRRRDDVDRDDAVQPEPPAARGLRQAGHPPGRWDADRVQHDRGLRRCLDGHRRHACVTRLARGDRRLDRARRARAPLRRPRVHRRLRQDDPGRRDGACAARSAGARALQRLDRGGPLPRGRRDDPGCLRGGRCACGRNDLRPRGACARERRVPGSRRVRRALHGEHDGDRARLPRRERPGAERDPGEPSRASRRRRCAPASSRCSSSWRTRARRRCSPARRSRMRSRRSRRPAARRTACCTCSRSRPRPASRSRSTTSTRSRRGRRSSPTSSPAAATSRPTSSRPAASRSSRASSCAPASSTRTRSAVDGRSLRQVADGAHERPGQDVVVSWDDPLKPTGGLAILRGNLAPDGCVVKLAGHERLHHRGPARVFDSEEACFAAVKARAIEPGRRGRDSLRGAGGRPGDARDAARHRRRSSAKGSATRSR